ACDAPKITKVRGLKPSPAALCEESDAHDKLIRAGFLRQSHSGIFHLLPLGKRVQDKLEGLIDHYMQDLGASRVALSTITSQELWRKSGRFSQLGSELFGFEDRKGAQYMLSPTHEEEITSLVAKTVKSYKELPLRLYQITRKFRDELRPRHGLLRSREFTMKDLYTFDISQQAALETYNKVQAAYAGIFGALKLPVMVAKASSGDMGGDLSHEYHLPTPIGEDTVINCSICDYTANTEVAETQPNTTEPENADMAAQTGISSVKVWRGISKDRYTLVNVWYPGQIPGRRQMVDMLDTDISIPAVKSVVPDLDASIENALSLWRDAIATAFTEDQTAANRPKLVNVVDFRLVKWVDELLRQETKMWPFAQSRSKLESVTVTEGGNGQGLNVLIPHAGDKCPNCDSGTLQVQKALEVGHTFHLGTRYSEPLGAMVSTPGFATSDGVTSQSLMTEKLQPMQMGCHGIGISRLIGAVVEHLADQKGLQWPRAIAPYEAVVIYATEYTEEAVGVYDQLARPMSELAAVDVVLDDRKVSFGWKLKDAELVGYPVVVLLGKVWGQSGSCELHCRRLGISEKVSLSDIRRRVSESLEKL
ncbi:prolyl-trna synthetase, partial [Colletotrichum truncatum]